MPRVSAPSGTGASTEARAVRWYGYVQDADEVGLASWGRSERREAPKRTLGRHFSSGGDFRAVHLGVRCGETREHGPCRQLIGDPSMAPGLLPGGPFALAGGIAGGG